MVVLGLPRSTYYAYKRAPQPARPHAACLERLSYALGIYRDLQIPLPDSNIIDRSPAKRPAAIWRQCAARSTARRPGGDRYATRRPGSSMQNVLDELEPPREIVVLRRDDHTPIRAPRWSHAVIEAGLNEGSKTQAKKDAPLGPHRLVDPQTSAVIRFLE